MAAGWTRHPVIAGFVGVLSGAVVIALVEWLAHQLLGAQPPALGAGITTPMFAAVLVAWVLGSATAAVVATAWCGRRSPVPGWVAAGLLLAGSVATIFAIPHPGWMIAGALLLMPAAAWLGVRGGAGVGR